MTDASLLCEVSCQERNEGSQEHHYEEQEASNSRGVSNLWYQDVPNR